VVIPTESKFQLQRANMLVQGQEPFEEDLEWLKYGKEIIKDSPKVLDEAAKGFLALGSSLLTVYTGALALFKLDEKASGPESWAIICIPIVLWLLCISSLAYVYFPDRLKFNTKSPSDIEKVARDISRKKSFRLKIGSVLFVAALAATSISIVWLGAQPSKETQMEEMTIHLAMTPEEIVLLKNMSVRPEEDTPRIFPVVLLIAENQTHLVQTPAKGDMELDRGSAMDKI
jgi:hypothetical protein